MDVKARVRGSKIEERIKSAAASWRRTQTFKGAVSDAGHWCAICKVCGSRWRVEFSQVHAGDGYCTEGATNYYNSNGILVKRA